MCCLYLAGLGPGECLLLSGWCYSLYQARGFKGKSLFIVTYWVCRAVKWEVGGGRWEVAGGVQLDTQ